MLLTKEDPSALRFGGKYKKTQCLRLFSPGSMNPSELCLSLMKSYETLYKKPYDEQNRKVVNEYKNGAAIGYGYLINSKSAFEKYKNGITESMADFIFEEDLYQYVRSVRHHVKVKLTQNEFDGLVMFAFHAGMSAFEQSIVLKIINGVVVKDLKPTWFSFQYSQDYIMRDLISRRTSEMKAFFDGVYSNV